MTFAPYGNIDLNPAYDYLKVLDVAQIYMLETGKFHYKFKKDLLPTVIGNYFETSADSIIQHNYGPVFLFLPRSVIFRFFGRKFTKIRIQSISTKFYVVG